MSECTIVVGDAGSDWPPVVDRFRPSETDFIEQDLSERADCQGAGVTIVGAICSIRADDDDGELTIGTTITAGLLITQFLTTSAVQTERPYGLIWAVTLSDGRLIQVETDLRVAPTRWARV